MDFNNWKVVQRASEPTSGTSPKTGNTWTKTEFLIEDASGGQYPGRVVVEVFNNQPLADWLDKNKGVPFCAAVSFRANYYEKTRRWYNSLSLSSVTIGGKDVLTGCAQGEAGETAKVASDSVKETEGGELPF